MNERTASSRRPLTGRHVLAITLAAFGVIVGVNLTMAALASGTFPGLVVKNSYVASQHFDADRERIAALGWSASLGYRDGVLTVRVTDGGDRPVHGLSVEATVGRPAAASTDRTIAVPGAGAGLYQAAAALAPGRWHVTLTIADEGREPVRISGPIVVEPAS